MSDSPEPDEAGPSQDQETRQSGKRCENCRSKRLYVRDGRLWCKRCGALQEDFILTQQDDDGPALKSSQITRQKKEAVEKASKALTGIKGLYLYLSSYQLILQHVCRALIDKKGLPQTLEPLVKDLWELRMIVVHERFLAIKPDDENEDSGTTMFSSQTEADSSQSDNDGLTGTNGAGRSGQVRGERDWPSIADMLGLCYFSCMILRIPLSVGTLFRWVSREEIPFLQTLRLVPPDMRYRLSSQWLSVLNTRQPLRPSRLYSSIHGLFALYNQHFGIVLPSLNYPPLLHQYVTTLGLPIDLFPSITHLSTILEDPFTFPKPRRRIAFLSQPEVNLICLLVISVKLFHPFTVKVGISLPLLQDQQPKLGALPLSWKVWLEAQRNLAHQKQTALVSPDAPLQPGQQVYITDKDVFTLNGQEMDSYMDWYERTWTTTTSRKQFRANMSLGDDNGENAAGADGVLASILNMFPASRQIAPTQLDSADNTPNEQDTEAKRRELHNDAIKFIQANSYTTNDATKEQKSYTPPPPGSSYQQYHYPSDLGAADSPARVFHERLAEHAGLTVGDLLRAVFKMERKLIKWWDRERKKGADSDDEVSDSTD